MTTQVPTPDPGPRLPVMTKRERFLNACRCLPVDRVPVWFMRQAGRYLPGYQRWRQQMAFADLLKRPDVAADISIEPLIALDVDAVILFSDILVLPEALGMPLRFTDTGPEFNRPLRDRAGIEALRIPDMEKALAPVLEALRMAVSAAGADVPVIGFAGGPITLALFMLEGRVSRQFEAARRFLYERPQDFGRLLELLTEALVPFLAAQEHAGAAVLQLFDSYAGLLSPTEFGCRALPPVRRVVEQLRAMTAVPIIYYVNECHPLLMQMAETGADVLGLDWRCDLEESRQRIGRPVALQGNLDPACLFRSVEQIEDRARTILRKGGAIGHIFNTGHGLLPDTPVERVQALVRCVQRMPAPALPD